MKKIDYTIEMMSDAELGSGCGSEIVNDVVARDHTGKPVLRASHLKGLLRDQLSEIGQHRDWSKPLSILCFGRAGRDGDDGIPSMVSVQDSKAKGVVEVRTITRSSQTDLGVVHGSSLRTTEAVAAGSIFYGQLVLEDGAPEVVEVALRLALLSLGAVGGGRTRGGGACLVKLDDDASLLPSVLLEKLIALVSGGVPEASFDRSLAVDYTLEPDAKPVVLRLTFEARDPVCCPDTPVVSSNVIQSGMGIPASAVQGAVISRLAKQDKALAQAVFDDARTRAWPLLPCSSHAAHALPVRVALSHRMSKLPDETSKEHLFGDVAIESYDWRTVAKGSPLKGSDGVLLREPEKDQVQLWKMGEMPRVLTSHSVHFEPGKAGERKDRNLFTVESQAPMSFSGLISLPAGAASAFERSLQENAEMTFGKARSVRGGGTLRAERIELADSFTGWQKKVFVLQSPAVIPDEWVVGEQSAEELLGQLVEKSGWGVLDETTREAGHIKVITQASCAVRFGWNRHGKGQGVAQTNRLRACRVFLPGTVFVLKEEPADLSARLVAGLGMPNEQGTQGRTQGYGAVLPHPGIAKKRYEPSANIETIQSKDSAGALALEWFNTSKSSGLSASQIAAVSERIVGNNADKAIEFLGRQKANRSARIWNRWKLVYDDVKEKIKANPKQAKRALRVWQDLLIVNAKKED